MVDYKAIAEQAVEEKWEEEKKKRIVLPNPLNNLTPEKEKELKRGIQSGMTEKKWSFNPLNGEVKTYDTKEDFDIDMSKGGFVPIDHPPAKNCKTCYGRGYVGKDIIHNYFAPCGCLFSGKKKGKLNV